MYIIDKNKDFYDYYSHIYGVDKNVVYDRRDSVILDQETIPKISAGYNPVSKYDDVRFVLLEIGLVQYLIKIFNFNIEKGVQWNIVDYDVECVNVFRDLKHRFSTPISIRGVGIRYGCNWNRDTKYRYDKKNITQGKYDEVIGRVFNNEIKNPIIGGTKLTSFLDPHNVWVELQTYISSLDNDKDCSTPMTDVEKAEIHGFDKKTSFRNPIK